MVYGIIDQRESGKTRLAIDLWLKDQSNTILVLPDLNSRTAAIKRMGEKINPEFIKNIKLFHLSVLNGLEITKIVIDEPFNKKKYSEFLKVAKARGKGKAEMYILGTFEKRMERHNTIFMKSYADIILDVATFRRQYFWESDTLQKFEQFYDIENT